jgi:transcriptional regulator with PAS, ATPase and Fis domain
MIADAIHYNSDRKDKPLIKVHCAALSETLLESELFGHERGAFTGAVARKRGRFELAHLGTIFLDEIGEVSPSVQVKLLRVLQEKTFEPLGGTRTQKVDVRIIAASNQNLNKLVSAGTFREDLYYRINVVTLKIPPLRDRREDIPLLLEHFIDRFNRLQGKEVAGVAPETLNILMNQKFPGNVRELMNIIEHAFVLCPGGVLLPEHLPDPLRPGESARRKTSPLSLSDLEAELIREALAQNGYNRSATARQLGIHKTTLWRKMKSLGINPDR